MRPLPKAIKARVNQMAHRRGQDYALMLRDSTLDELQTLATGGMAAADLLAALDRIEAAEPIPSQSAQVGSSRAFIERTNNV